MKYFKIILTVLGLITATMLFSEPTHYSKKAPLFTFGIGSDFKVSDTKTDTEKKSIKQLQRFVQKMNRTKPDAVILLGNLVQDSENALFEAIFQLSCLGMPFFTVAGASDFQAFGSDPQQTYKALTMPKPFYIEEKEDEEEGVWRLIFLDGNQMSPYAWKKNSLEYKKAMLYHQKKAPAKPILGGGIGKEQLKWLKLELKRAKQEEAKVIVFCNRPIYPESKETLWDSADILKAIKGYTCLKAWVSTGKENAIGSEGVLFINNPLPEKGKNNFSLLNIYQNQIELLDENNRLLFRYDLKE